MIRASFIDRAGLTSAKWFVHHSTYFEVAGRNVGIQHNFADIF